MVSTLDRACIASNTITDGSAACIDVLCCTDGDEETMDSPGSDDEDADDASVCRYSDDDLRSTSSGGGGDAVPGSPPPGAGAGSRSWRNAEDVCPARSQPSHTRTATFPSPSSRSTLSPREQLAQNSPPQRRQWWRRRRRKWNRFVHPSHSVEDLSSRHSATDVRTLFAETGAARRWAVEESFEETAVATAGRLLRRVRMDAIPAAAPIDIVALAALGCMLGLAVVVLFCVCVAPMTVLQKWGEVTSQRQGSG